MAMSIKKISFISIGGLAVVAGLLLVVPNFINWNNYRDTIKSGLSTITGRDVTIEGEINFKLLPSPALTASGVTISNMAGFDSPYLAKLNRLDINVSLMPLLSGDIEILSLLLDEPDIYLETREAEGINSWDMPASDGVAETELTTDEEAATFSVNNFIIQNGSIHYLNSAQKQNMVVNGLSARVRATSMSGPFTGTLAFSYADIPVQLSAEMNEWKGGQRIPFSVGLVLNLDNPGVQLSGTLLSDPGVWEMNGRLRGQGQNLGRFITSIRALGLEAYMPALPENLNLAHEWDLSSGIKTTNMAGKLSALSFKVGNSNGTFGATWDFDKSDAQTLNSELLLKNLDLDEILVATTADIAGGGGQDTAILFDGLPTKMPFTGKQSIAATAIRYQKGDIRNLVLNMSLADDRLNIAEAKALLPGNADVYLRGSLALGDSPEFKGSARMATTALRDSLSWMGIDASKYPAETLESFSFSSELSLTPAALSLSEATIQLDVSQFDGGLSWGLGATPKWRVNGHLGRINLDAFLGAEPQNVAQQTPAEAFDAMLDQVAAQAGQEGVLKLTIDQMRYHNGTIAGTEVDLKMAPNALIINRFKTNIENLDINVSGSIDNVSAVAGLNLQYDITSNNLNRFLTWSDYQGTVKGDDIGYFAAKGTVGGLRGAYQLHSDFDALRGKASVDGVISGNPLVADDLNLTLTASHPGHLDLMRRLDDSFVVEGRSLPLTARLTLMGKPDALKVKGQVEALAAVVDLDGVLTIKDDNSGYQGRLTVRHPSIYQLAQTLGHDLMAETMAAKPDISLRADVNVSAQYMDIKNLSGAIAGTNVAGAFSADQQRHTLTADMTMGRLDFTHYLAKGTSGVEEAKQPGGQRWSEAPIDTTLLQQYRGQFRFKAEGLKYHDYDFTNVVLAADLTDNGLQWTDNRANLWQGALTTSGSLKMADALTLKTTFNVAKLELGNALPTLFGLDVMQSKADLSADLSATGATQVALVQSLAGSLKLVSQGGELKGVALALLDKNLRSAKTIPTFLENLDKTMAGGKTVVQPFEADFVMENGQMKMASNTIETKEATIQSELLVNLGLWSLNGQSQIGMKTMADLPPITLSYNGSLGKPDIAWDRSKLSSFMAQNLTRSLLNNLVKSFVPAGAENEEAAKMPESVTSAVQRILEKAKVKKEEKKDDKKGNNN